MGKPRFLLPDLNAGLLFAVALALLFVGCGDDAGLLGSADTDEIYSGAGGGGGYGVTSRDPADFGTITGKVSYEGRRRRGRVDLSRPYCINKNPNGMLSENFLVGDNGELGGVIVYVKRGLGKVDFAVPSEPLILDQKACRYIPHLAVLRVGQDLIIRNSDRHEPPELDVKGDTHRSVSVGESLTLVAVADDPTISPPGQNEAEHRKVWKSCTAHSILQ